MNKFKKEDKIVKIGRYSAVEIVIGFLGGIFFGSLGTYFVLAIIISEVNEVAKGKVFDSFIFFPLSIMLVFIVCGLLLLIFTFKRLRNRIKFSKTKRYGEETYAVVTSYNSKSKNNNHRHRGAIICSLKLSYTEKDEKKIFNTDYIYLLCEAKYLRCLNKVKIKSYKNFVVVTEEYRYKDILKYEYLHIEEIALP